MTQNDIGLRVHGVLLAPARETTGLTRSPFYTTVGTNPPSRGVVRSRSHLALHDVHWSSIDATSKATVLLVNSCTHTYIHGTRVSARFCACRRGEIISLPVEHGSNICPPSACRPFGQSVTAYCSACLPCWFACALVEAAVAPFDDGPNRETPCMRKDDVHAPAYGRCGIAEIEKATRVEMVAYCTRELCTPTVDLHHACSCGACPAAHAIQRAPAPAGAVSTRLITEYEWHHHKLALGNKAEVVWSLPLAARGRDKGVDGLSISTWW